MGINTSTTDVSQISSLVDQQMLKTQFSKDIREYLSSNPHQTLKSVCGLMNGLIDEENLKNIINMKIYPSPRILRAFYAIKYQEEQDDILFDLLPAVVGNELKNYYDYTDTPKSVGPQTQRVNELITTDQHFAELYVLTCFESGVSLEYIKEEYGNRALKIIYDMIAQNIAVIDNKTDKIYPGKVRSNYPPQVIGCMAQAALRFFQENTQNIDTRIQSGQVYFKSLNQDALERLIEIDNDAYNQKMQVITDTDSKGEIPVFTLSFTDKIKDLSCDYKLRH